MNGADSFIRADRTLNRVVAAIAHDRWEPTDRLLGLAGRDPNRR